MNNSSKLITKGVVALAAVAIVGTVTTAYAVTNSNLNAAGNSGYGTPGDNAIDAAAEFDAMYASLSSDFRTQIMALAQDSKTALETRGILATNDFEKQFLLASDNFDHETADALAAFRAQVVKDASSAESKDKFIDAFNHAKADYFNRLDEAKNRLAATLSNIDHESNVIKDTFMNGFNSKRDAYGNNLEAIKNRFADRVTNNHQ